MEKLQNIIYGLRDPRNDVYQYIGKSSIGLKRPLKHLTKSHSALVNEWVKQLEDNWLYPEIDVIEVVDDLSELLVREQYWISYYYNINPNLLNVQSVKVPMEYMRNKEDIAIFNFLNNIFPRLSYILRRERLFRNLTQAEMAEHMGVSRSTVSDCENDGNITLDILKTYIRTLKGIDILRKSKGEKMNNRMKSAKRCRVKKTI